MPLMEAISAETGVVVVICICSSGAYAGSWRHVVTSRYVQPPRAHHLIGTKEIGNRRESAPHVHQAAEGEQQKDRHAKNEMDHVGPVERDQRIGIRPEGVDVLRPP